MKITNKDLIQSYILTTAKYDYSVYEKRILYRIIERLQVHTQGLTLNAKYEIKKDLFDDYHMTFDISSFLNSKDDKNNNRVKKALSDLNDKSFIYEDDDAWEKIRIIESPKITGLSKKYDTTVTFRVDKRVHNAFLNFSKGFRKFELTTAMMFESHYSMRFYELFSNVKQPITYELEKLKEMFGIGDKYQNKPSNFLIKVVDVAKKELDKKAPYSFDYKTIKTGRTITHIMFIPRHIPANRDPELEKKQINKQVSLRWVMDINHLRELKNDLDFSDQEIKNNQEVIESAYKNPNYREEYADLKANIRKGYINNPKGLYISVMKKLAKSTKTSVNTNMTPLEKHNLKKVKDVGDLSNEDINYDNIPNDEDIDWNDVFPTQEELENLNKERAKND